MTEPHLVKGLELQVGVNLNAYNWGTLSKGEQKVSLIIYNKIPRNHHPVVEAIAPSTFLKTFFEKFVLL